MTESELLDKMNENKIGTDASMSQHITNILKRNYVSIEDEKTRTIVPTKMGRDLYSFYKEFQPDLVSVRLRATIEDKINEIAKAKDLNTFVEILTSSIQVFRQKFINISKNLKIIIPNLKEEVERNETMPKAKNGGLSIALYEKRETSQLEM